jgi:hypothetical protein
MLFPRGSDKTPLPFTASVVAAIFLRGTPRLRSFFLMGRCRSVVFEGRDCEKEEEGDSA